ncbi:uncharacterized protein N7459_004623 [Penicillium hispanicum]|uniref:uncharacterized protein n=1 Tax=Penicillium hispanicum TaxID=1080232 RepID=UPI002541E4EE|nr:uncharacterized protein N7459_004623 [Penicillium hispanicum]KAJ5584823.1 hypothetical protein N7459_004623 [Penicillium hispanicum]
MIPLLLFNDGDTLVYIVEAPEDRGEYISSTPTIPHRIPSERLLATGSSYFERLFKPRYQTRLRKQRGFANGLPEGIKYVIDLTPPTLDEDAIIVLTELSCPMGIRTWAAYKSLWKLPSTCVGGQDEREVVERPPVLSNVDLQHGEPDEEIEQTTQNIFSEDSYPGESVVQEEAVLRPRWSALPVEYSAKRHREGIEHVLNVLMGLNVTLNTPCKLWTFFAVAKIFDVGAFPAVSGYITSWFYESANTRFIEIHPEIAYRVACGIKAVALCRHAFASLVGEEALLYLIRSAQLTPMPYWRDTFAKSRIADFLDDTEVQRVEYASKSFAEEVIGHFLHLIGAEMHWISEIGEFRKLSQHAQDFPQDKNIVLDLIVILTDFIRFQIYEVLNKCRDPWRSSDVVPEGEIGPYTNAFDGSQILQRIVGKKFWKNLLGHNFNQSGHLLMTGKHKSVAEIGNGLLAFRGQENARIDRVFRAQVGLSVTHFNDTLDRRVDETNAIKLPTWPSGRNRQLTLTLNPRRQQAYVEEPAGSSSATASRNAPPLDPDVSPFFAMDNSPPEQSSQTPLPINFTGTNSSNPIIDKENRRFDLNLFLTEVSTYITTYVRKVFFPYDPDGIVLELTDTLTCLTDNEYRFLPLWAGGNDDGSGGVFTDHHIPNLDTGGFSAPGPAVHTGSVASTDDSLSEINPSDSQSTVHGASHHATYSHVSDIMSVDSGDAENVLGVEDLDTSHLSSTVSQDDQEFSMAPVQFDEDGEVDAHSDSISTVVMGSGNLSDFSDDDDDMAPPSPGNHTDDTMDFELVDESM